MFAGRDASGTDFGTGNTASEHECEEADGESSCNSQFKIISKSAKRRKRTKKKKSATVDSEEFVAALSNSEDHTDSFTKRNQVEGKGKNCNATEEKKVIMDTLIKVEPRDDAASEDVVTKNESGTRRQRNISKENGIESVLDNVLTNTEEELRVKGVISRENQTGSNSDENEEDSITSVDRIREYSTSCEAIVEYEDEDSDNMKSGDDTEVEGKEQDKRANGKVDGGVGDNSTINVDFFAAKISKCSIPEGQEEKLEEKCYEVEIMRATELISSKIKLMGQNDKGPPHGKMDGKGDTISQMNIITPAPSIANTFDDGELDQMVKKDPMKDYLFNIDFTQLIEPRDKIIYYGNPSNPDDEGKAIENRETSDNKEGIDNHDGGASVNSTERDATNVASDIAEHESALQDASTSLGSPVIKNLTVKEAMGIFQLPNIGYGDVGVRRDISAKQTQSDHAETTEAGTDPHTAIEICTDNDECRKVIDVVNFIKEVTSTSLIDTENEEQVKKLAEISTRTKHIMDELIDRAIPTGGMEKSILCDVIQRGHDRNEEILGVDYSMGISCKGYGIESSSNQVVGGKRRDHLSHSQDMNTEDFNLRRDLISPSLINSFDQSSLNNVEIDGRESHEIFDKVKNDMGNSMLPIEKRVDTASSEKRTCSLPEQNQLQGCQHKTFKSTDVVQSMDAICRKAEMINARCNVHQYAQEEIPDMCKDESMNLIGDNTELSVSNSKRLGEKFISKGQPTDRFKLEMTSYEASDYDKSENVSSMSSKTKDQLISEDLLSEITVSNISDEDALTISVDRPPCIQITQSLEDLSMNRGIVREFQVRDRKGNRNHHLLLSTDESDSPEYIIKEHHMEKVHELMAPFEKLIAKGIVDDYGEKMSQISSGSEDEAHSLPCDNELGIIYRKDKGNEDNTVIEGKGSRVTWIQSKLKHQLSRSTLPKPKKPSRIVSKGSKIRLFWTNIGVVKERVDRGIFLHPEPPAELRPTQTVTTDEDLAEHLKPAKKRGFIGYLAKFFNNMRPGSKLDDKEDHVHARRSTVKSVVRSQHKSHAKSPAARKSIKKSPINAKKKKTKNICTKPNN